MSNDWIKVEDLKPTAKTLALGAEHLEDAAKAAPKVPDAGSSTDKLGEAMVKLYQGVGKLATQLGRAADVVQASDAAYKNVDQQNSKDINGVTPPSNPRAVK